jgi:hypothetical protein
VLPPALVVLAAACLLLTTAIALAGPAAAIEDPRRPTAEVTHGPSCGPAVVRVAVTNGTAGHRVALVFDSAQEQDAALLGSGQQAELASGDVGWGQTVDVSITVAGPDGTAEAPIRFGTYTRPSAEDCTAVTPMTPPGQGATEPVPATTSSGRTSAPGTPPSTSSTSSSPTRPSTAGVPRPTDTAPAPGIPRSTAPATTSSSSPGRTTGQPGSASVSPGGVVTVRATGFTSGEPVIVSMLGVDDPLTTVTAGADGSVEAVVQIPRGAQLGTATMQLVGGLSDATAGLHLQVAARSQPLPEQTTSAPVLAAGMALICAAAALGMTAARRSRGDHRTTPR